MTKSKTIQEVLSQIQQNLKVPKGQTNKFGGYKYRSCEDIMEAVKKILPEGYSIIATDDMVMLDDRYYLKATVYLLAPNGERIDVNGFARESEDKKGMDHSQITGTASSYARKYAANGLLAIDDTKDADTDSFTRTTKGSETASKKPVKKKGGNQNLNAKELLELLQECKNDEDLNEFRKTHGALAKSLPESKDIMTEFKKLKTKYKETK